MQTSSLIQHLVDLNTAEAEQSQKGTLAPFGATHSASRLSKAEEAGYERGRASLQAEMRQAVLDMKTDADARLRDHREQWVEKEAEKLASDVEAGLAKVRLEMAESLTRMLLPFLAGRLEEAALEEIAVAAGGVINECAGVTVELSGREDLSRDLAGRLEMSADYVKVSPDEKPEVRVKIDSTLLETRLADWLKDIEGALR